MLKNAFFVILLSFSFSVFAQDNIPNRKIWSLEECINYAQKNSLSIQRNLLNNEANEITYQQSIANLFPSVRASASNSYRIGNARIPNSEITVQDNAHLANIGLDASVNIFSGFQTRNTIKQNKAFLKASLADLQQAENNIALDVASAYLDILFNQELLNVSNLQLKSALEQVTRTEKLVQAGALAEASLLDVKAQASTAELNVVNAENAYVLSKLFLLQILLLPADTDFEIFIPELDALENTPIEIATSQELYNIALNTQPVIKSAEYNIVGARYQTMAAKGARMPSLSAFGGLSSNYYRKMTDSTKFDYSEFRGQIRDQFNTSYGIQLSIPIFNNWQVRTQVQNAIISGKRAELTSIETKNTLRQNVEQAFTNVKAASKRFYASKNQVDNLRESFRITEQRFNVGAVNSLDYLLAKNNFNQAESDLIRAKYDYIFRLKILDFYQNKPLTLTSQ